MTTDQILFILQVFCGLFLIILDKVWLGLLVVLAALITIVGIPWVGPLIILGGFIGQLYVDYKK